MPRGRPLGSLIRQRLVTILASLGSAYGYELHKIYCELYPPCTREVVYYHLRTGVRLGEFLIERVASEQGDYSWGNSVEKIYYQPGPAAIPKKDPAVITYIEAYKQRRTPLAKKQTQELIPAETTV